MGEYLVPEGYMGIHVVSLFKSIADVSAVLSELELTIKKVKVSTTPDGKVIDMFFITDTRCKSFGLL